MNLKCLLSILLLWFLHSSSHPPFITLLTESASTLLKKASMCCTLVSSYMLVCSTHLLSINLEEIKTNYKIAVSYLYNFAKASWSKYSELDGLKREIYCRIVLESRSPKSRCWQSWFCPRPLREGPSPGLSSWPIDDHPLLVSSHCPSCLCVQASQFYKDTSHFGLGSTLMTLLQFTHLCRDALSK